MKGISNINIIPLCYYRIPVSRVSTISWQMYKTDSYLYYYINSANSESRHHYIADRIEFWNTLIPQINVPSYLEITTSTKFPSASTNFPSTPSSTLSSTNNTTSNHNITSQQPTTGQGSTVEVTTLVQACADIQTIQQIYMISTFSLSGLIGLLVIAIIVIIIKTKKPKTSTA